MSSFSAFNDYRVGAWMTDGVMDYIEAGIESLTAPLKSAVAAIVVGVSIATVNALAIPATAATVNVVGTIESVKMEHQSSLSDIDQALLQLDNEIAAQLAMIENFSDEFVNPESFAIAQKAVVAVADRKGAFAADWATSLFPEGN